MTQPPFPKYGPPNYGPPNYGPPNYGPPNYSSPNYGAPTWPPPPSWTPPPPVRPGRRRRWPWVAGGVIVVAALVTGGILISHGSGPSHSAGGSGPDASGSTPAGFPSTSASATSDISCSSISQIPLLSAHVGQLGSTDAAAPSGIPLPADSPSIRCAGTLTFGSQQDPTYIYGYDGITASSYGSLLDTDGWTEYSPGSTDEPAVFDLDSNDWEIDYFTSGQHLVVIMDDVADSSTVPDTDGPTS